MGVMRVEEVSLIATAEAIREKTGEANPIEWVANKGFSDAVAGIQAGEQYPSANGVTFPYYYMDGDDKLPPIPEDIVGYPNMFIRKNLSSGVYHLIMAAVRGVYKKSVHGNMAIVYGDVNFNNKIYSAKSGDATWTFLQESGLGSIDLDERYLLAWSNYDIYYDSFDSGRVYFSRRDTYPRNKSYIVNVEDICELLDMLRDETGIYGDFIFPNGLISIAKEM